jgi:predicted Zn-dependent peptidase
VGAVGAPLTLALARRVLFVARPHATQTEITVALATPSPGAPQSAALQAMRAHLGRSLTKQLREKEGVTYGVNPFLRALGEAAVLGVTTAVDQNATGRAVGVMLGALQGLGETPLAEEEVARVRWELARQYALAFDQVGGASEALLRQAEHRWPADYYETFPEQLAHLDGAAVQAEARALGVGHEVVVVVGDPDKALPQLQQAGYAVEVDQGPAAPKKAKPRGSAGSAK